MIPILVWNCQGAGKKKFARLCRDLRRDHKPEVMAIFEPRISGRKAEQVIQKLRFPNSHRIEARGFAGGIWLLWDESRVQVSVLFNHPQLMHVRIEDVHSSFLFTAVYGCPQEGWRRCLWRNLEALAATIDEPWLVAGDFNAVVEGSERLTRLGRPGQANALFVDCLLQTNLLDLGFVGNRFTWKSGNQYARLDRFLSNSTWRTHFAEASVYHLPRVGSDHCPVLIRTGPSPPPASDRPFRFQAGWLTHQAFPKFVADNWDASLNFYDTVQRLTFEAKKWNKEVFGNIHMKKRRLLARIAVWPSFKECVEWEVKDGQSVFFWGDKWIKENDCLLNLVSSPVPDSLLKKTVAQMTNPEGRWRWELISPYVSADIIRELALFTSPTDNAGEDNVLWAANSKGINNHAAIWPSIFGTACWTLWKWRNQRVFEPHEISIHNPVQFILNTATNYAKAWLGTKMTACWSNRICNELQWFPPHAGMIKCNIAIVHDNLLDSMGVGGILRNWKGDWRWNHARREVWDGLQKSPNRMIASILLLKIF
ncbi:hypothetical protein Tsubulata_014831 [Turnera subulata]|uniref:Endonuclease/exonuclease/phosphatase domain-containing protein n=1 Tax=Turnera subulata TaxID=218843 RepID=A0A9Q0J7U7_9ROSI|nr:hypothetical protein Tsubulata_014831 [Turnera subulata]